MAPPRIFDPEIREQRGKEQRRRFNHRNRLMLELFQTRHPRLYNKVRAEAEQMVSEEHGELTGGTNPNVR